MGVRQEGERGSRATLALPTERVLAGPGLRYPVGDARCTPDGPEPPPCRGHALEAVNERRAAVTGKERQVCEGPLEHIPLTRGPPKVVRVQWGQANQVPVPAFSQGERDEGLRRLSEQNARLRGQFGLLGQARGGVHEDGSRFRAGPTIAAERDAAGHV